MYWPLCQYYEGLFHHPVYMIMLDWSLRSFSRGLETSSAISIGSEIERTTNSSVMQVGTHLVSEELELDRRELDKQEVKQPEVDKLDLAEPGVGKLEQLRKRFRGWHVLALTLATTAVLGEFLELGIYLLAMILRQSRGHLSKKLPPRAAFKNLDRIGSRLYRMYRVDAILKS
ncbi:hypothetical protein Tco_1539252 [Tanacetum coccineum]